MTLATTAVLSLRGLGGLVGSGARLLRTTEESGATICTTSRRCAYTGDRIRDLTPSAEARDPNQLLCTRSYNDKLPARPVGCFSNRPDGKAGRNE